MSLTISFVEARIPDFGENNKRIFECGVYGGRSHQEPNQAGRAYSPPACYFTHTDLH
jgi:hypothetical protein